MSKLSDTAKGVESAFDFWLSQHDISVPELMEDAIKKAAADWFDDHTEEIITSIVSSADRRLGMACPHCGRCFEALPPEK